ncbi:hypothetical protein INT48_006528 [Thamnidium elegans]|uniref:Methyltransferase domain-containing protein n=1 Tax=Thamnidium elegans TaxID=101142 RepID=A0A8H7VXM2_9FUNG|nr:hypothetical protein INT48_006528 [Thamnidium elegans]
MHLFDKDKILQTLIQACTKKKNNSDKLIADQPSPPVKKKSNQTLESLYPVNQHSIKALTKNALTSIADSGVSISRSGSVMSHSISFARSSDESSSSTDILFPDEECEADRMVSQHYTLRTAFDGLDFSAPILPLLSQKDTVVLDIGCGSGTWTMEIATQFPSAKFIGLDRKSLFPRDIKPKNCQFRLFDIIAVGGQVHLPFEDASIDFIFQRDMNWGLSESIWTPLMREYFRILKPGGWIELVEPDIETNRASTYENLLINKLVNNFYRRQQDPFVSKRLSTFAATTGYRRIQSDFKSMPLGWGFQKLYCKKTQKTTLRCSEFARAAAQHRLDLLQSLQHWFLSEGHISRSKFESIINRLPEQWHKNRAYTNWHRTIAQKPFFN